METIEKINVAAMKADIKEMVELQKFYKNQRKTVKKDCSRKFGDMPDISPSEATYKHQANREDLRVMYAAYGLARGKSLSQIENHYSEDNHPLSENPFPLRIERIQKKYTIKVEVETEEI